jgi:hypothetical protein
MSAEIYNKIRRIIFSTANNPQNGFAVAREWLENTYRFQLDYPSYVGLKAELQFYEQYRSEFKLTVAGDMGEHADFAGHYEGVSTRFDVTTNLHFKDFSNYEPHIGDGISYRIALLDQTNFEIVNVFDLAFQRCNCGGHLIPVVTMLDGNRNRHGEPTWDNDQVQMNICTYCHQFVTVNRFYNQVRFSPQEYYNDLSHFDDDEERDQIYAQYCVDNYKYYRRRLDDNLMGIAEVGYFPDGYKGEDGYWGIGFAFLNRAVESAFPRPIRTDGPVE